MSEIEESRVAAKDEASAKNESKPNLERTRSVEESQIPKHTLERRISKQGSTETEGTKEKEEKEGGTEKKRAEWEKEEAPKSALVRDTPPTSASPTADRIDRADRADPSPPPPQPLPTAEEAGTAKREERQESGVGVISGDTRNENADERRSSVNAAVGEWNSLPVLVERLRAALELSLATGSRRTDGTAPATLPEDSGIDSEEDQRIRNSMEQAVLGCSDPDVKKDLKFLEDLLLSDIQTALSRLRETLDKTDVDALAKHGAASDPSSKLHLLRLVSSLLSRLQVPEEPACEPPKSRLPAGLNVKDTATNPTPPSRRRKGTRHTIGVSAEELARARKWLEEERSVTDLARLEDAAPLTAQRAEELIISPAVSNGPAERRPEEVHDKYTKDAINQRQSLRDKSRDSRIEGCGYRAVFSKSNHIEVPMDESLQEKTMIRYQDRPSVESHQKTRMAEEDPNVNEENEERSRVSKLAAALRQRAELASSAKYPANNKFSTKKLKIKRANTIDIPSYLKLQAESLGRDNAGCVSLRRPINVGDKATSSANVIVPSFQPKTENDRKFLALISKNNEAPNTNPLPPFKAFGQTKPNDLSALTNENWNSRFANIKTAFDRNPSIEERENQPIPKLRSPRRPSGVPHPPRFVSSPKEKTPENTFICNGAPIYNVGNSPAGFRHAPSSPFRKIEKSPVTPPAVYPKPAPTYHWPKNNAPVSAGNLREKAKMFDKDNVPPQQSVKQRFEDKFNEESLEKSFPRPPWIEHERSEGKQSGPVAENGRIDYRSFCKQFAPFVGKSVTSDMKIARGFENQRQDVVHHQRRGSNDVGHAKNPNVVEGKISFKTVPEKHSFDRQRSRIEPHPEVTDNRKFSAHSIKTARDPIQTRRENDFHYDMTEPQKTNAFPDATFRGSASVAVQTGYDEEVPNEVRSFRVGPKISKGPPSICSNAAVQTNAEIERTVMPVIGLEVSKQQTTSNYDCRNPQVLQQSCRLEDPRRFAPEQNCNQDYRTVVANPSVRNGPLDSSGQVYNTSECNYKLPMQNVISQSSYREPECTDRLFEKNSRIEYPYRGQIVDNTDNRFHDQLYTAPELSNRVLENETAQHRNKPNWNHQDANYLDDENIQNQDISSETGVVTRYTCAIATVASTDSPESRSEEGFLDSRSLTPSPSRPSPLPRPHPTHDDAPTPEEEIRRHNMLQQSLVRRLQHTDGTMNDQTNYNRPSVINQPPSGAVRDHFNYGLPAAVNSHVNRIVNDYHQSGYNRPAIVNQHPSVILTDQHSYSRPATVKQSNKFLSPDIHKKVESTPTLNVPLTGSSVSISNRVTALREAYEQPTSQAKPIRKERSPVPNGVNLIDSSDEYLVSCANKSSRSIVLSKSESWHQLALSNSNVRITKPSSTTQSSTPKASILPKPPKPKSPASHKLKSKQYEASSAADSVKKMEDKIRRYFDNPNDGVSNDTKDSSRRKLSPRSGKGLLGLTRSQTMPGICENKLQLTMPSSHQMPLSNLNNLNSAEVDKVFDDLFEEATRSNDLY